MRDQLTCTRLQYVYYFEYCVVNPFFNFNSLALNHTGNDLILKKNFLKLLDVVQPLLKQFPPAARDTQEEQVKENI